MSNWEKMNRTKKIKALQSPYRLIYLSSIAAFLTLGSTIFFRLHKQKENIQNKNNWRTIKGVRNTFIFIWSKIVKLLFGKKS